MIVYLCSTCEAPDAVAVMGGAEPHVVVPSRATPRGTCDACGALAVRTVRLIWQKV